MMSGELDCDDIDRRTKVKRYLGAQEIVWQTVYDDATNTRKEIDPLGIEVAYHHDPLDRLRYVKWTEGGVGKQTEYGYDEADNRTAQLDANGNATSWDHDAMDRMTKEEDAAGDARHFGYDGVGNVLLRVDAEGRVTTYERDATSNETARIYGGYQTAEGEKVETEYDTNANRKKVRTPLGEWRWKYDALNRMTGRDEPPIGIEDPNYPPLVTAWYYDYNGNVERLIGPDGGLTDYEYDARNRMTKVTRKDTESDPDPRITTYSYYENNLPKLKTLPNGCEAYHEYDELDRLTLLVNRKSDQTVISSFAIEYRDDDNKSKITQEDGTVIEYDYDDQKRLTKEKWTAADQTVLHNFEYTYDAVGNRLTKVYNSVTTDYDYNNLNQLTQEQTGSAVTTYGYDREGNTIRKTEPAKETLYSWNPENMLTKAQFSDSTPTNEFSYDMDSVRAEKVDSEGRKQHHWEGYRRLLVRTGVNVEAVGIAGTSVVPHIGFLLFEEGTEEDRYDHLDWMGSCTASTNAASEVVDTVAQDGFGCLLEGALPLPRYAYCSQEWESDLAAYSFVARHYLPGLGRFASRDTFLANLKSNLYPFARNSPVNVLELLGLQEITPEWWGLTTGYEIGVEGERLAVKRLRERGRYILRTLPNPAWPKADIIALDPRAGTIEFVDAKLFTKEWRRVRESPALVQNFFQSPNNINLAEVALKEAEQRGATDIFGRTIPRSLLKAALRSIRGKSPSYIKYVASPTGRVIGVTAGLREAGVAYMASTRGSLKFAVKEAERMGEQRLANRFKWILQRAPRYTGKVVKCFPFFVFLYEWSRGRPARAAANIAARNWAAADEVDVARELLGNEVYAWMEGATRQGFGYDGAAYRAQQGAPEDAGE